MRIASWLSPLMHLSASLSERRHRHLRTLKFAFKPARRRRSELPRIAVESLENRALLSATANDDSGYMTVHDQSLTESAPGVLNNDTADMDGNGMPLPMTASLVSGPGNGSVSLNGDGSFVYTPNTGFVGADTFTYNISGSNTATVTINVLNNAPSASDDSSYMVTHDQTLNEAAPGVLGNDSGDMDGDSVTAILVDDVTNGTLTFNADGSFVYTPNGGYVGSDSFTYKLNDGLVDGNTATVTINVFNNAPSASDDSSYMVTHDQTLNEAAPGVLGNDSGDMDGDSVTAILVDDVTNGTLTFNADGSFDYTPNAGYVGSDSFTYKLNDGLVDGNTVTVTINVLNNAPGASDDSSYMVTHDRTLNEGVPGVLGNDSGDLDGDPVTAILVDDVTNGTLTFNADGSFTYTPNTGYFGSDSFTYKLNDGLTDSNTAAVTINVLNNDPQASGDIYSAIELAQLSVVASNGVLTNDSDGDFDPLQALLYSPPTYGTVLLATDGSFVYTPTAEFVGFDTFFYRAFDGFGYSPPTQVDIGRNKFAIKRDGGIDVDPSVPIGKWISEGTALEVNGIGPNPPAVQSYQWTVPGAHGRGLIVSEDYFHGHEVGLSASDYQKQNIGFYWYADGAWAVQVTITPVVGAAVTKVANYNVSKPNVAVLTTTDSTHTSFPNPNNPIAMTYGLGILDGPDATPGVEFRAIETWGPGGEFAWYSILNSWNTIGTFAESPLNSQPPAGPGMYVFNPGSGLDAGDTPTDAPAEGDTFTDHPSLTIPVIGMSAGSTAGPGASVSHTASWSTYLMWISPNDPSTMVPVKRVDWTWTFYVSAQDDGMGNWEWGPPDSQSVTVTVVDSIGSFPSWDNAVIAGAVTWSPLG